jgi:hypothetical protein
MVMAELRVDIWSLLCPFKLKLIQFPFVLYLSTSRKKWIACVTAARDGAELASGFNNKKSWIVALYRVITTSTPASISLRPYASPSSRRTSFSAVTIRVRDNPLSSFVDASKGDAEGSFRFS